MKKYNIYLLLGILVSIPFGIFCSGFDSLKHKTAHQVIEISSLLTINGVPTSHYTVYLSLDGTIQDSFTVEKAKPVYFILERNYTYGLVYKKTGFADKIVIVDTSLPEMSGKQNFYTVDFEIEIDPEISTHKVDFLDFPVAFIRFDNAKQKFSYSERYFFEVHRDEPITRKD